MLDESQDRIPVAGQASKSQMTEDAMTKNSQAKTADGKQLDALLATDTQSAVQTSAMKSMSALHSKTKPGDS